MSKSLPGLTAASALDGSEEMLVGQNGNPRRTTALEVAGLAAKSPNAPALNIMDFIPQAQWAGIQSYTTLLSGAPYDCYNAILAAIAALPAANSYPYGGAIQFPPGYYYVSLTIQLKEIVQLIGAGGLSGVTVLAWPSNTAGIVVNNFDTNNNAVESPATTTAAGSYFRGLSFQGYGAYSGNTTGDGVRLRARAHFEDCQWSEWPGSGLVIGASVGSDDANRGNANNWSIKDCWSHDNGANGVAVYGSDVNAGIATGLSVATNGAWATLPPPDPAHSGWGIDDFSFLGNTYVGCHAEFNHSGPYQSTNANARNIFLGCYSESDAYGGSNLLTPAMCIGGLHAAGFKATTTATIFDSSNFRAAGGFNVNSIVGDSNRGFQSTIGYAGGTLTMRVDGGGQQHEIGFWHDNSGSFVDQSGYGDGYVYSGSSCLVRTTDLSSFVDNKTGLNVPSGEMIFPQAYYVNLGSRNAWRVLVSYGSAAPTGANPLSQDWSVGNIVYNTAPAPGGYIGWVCTAPGSPGTWKTFGPISA